MRRHTNNQPSAPLDSLLFLVSAKATLLIGAFIALRWHTRRASRRANPKDYAFRVAYAWGPDLKLPKIERLKKHLTWVSEQELESWLPELEQAEKSLGFLAEEGGPKVLGETEVERRIKAMSPFLVAEGLRHAKFLVGYAAMHDGYDKNPLRRAAGDA